jgi:hypothetical protein
MPDAQPAQSEKGQTMNPDVKNWVMVSLTFIFIALYVLALTNVIHPLPDYQMVGRIESIIAVIIGYYFGRLPSQQREQSLKADADEAKKKQEHAQSKEADQRAQGQATEQKLKDADAVLETAQASQPKNFGPDSSSVGDAPLRHAVTAARKILLG